MSFWRSREGGGILLIVLATLAFAALDTATKYAVALAPVLMLLWFRYAFQAVLTFVLRFPVQKFSLLSILEIKYIIFNLLILPSISKFRECLYSNQPGKLNER